MKYLITGGAGFIGSHLAESLLADGHQVKVIDNLATGSVANLAAVIENPALRFVEADILEYAGLDRDIADTDAVIHLAAAVGVELVVHDPVHTIITNVHGTERVLNSAAKHNRRTLIASTSEVYGKSKEAEFKETDDLLIGSSYHSRWSYACSKLLDEFYLMAHHRASGFPGTVMRFFNIVGPRQTGRYGMVIPRLVEAALRGKPIPVYGDGTQSRCFCHVFDTVKAIRGLVGCDAAVGHIYNIGSRNVMTIQGLAERIVERLGSSSEIELIPYEQAYEKGFEDMLRRRPSTEAIRELTGWQPTLDLDRIIDDVAAQLKREL
jgi:UDP-glucose 4-epimerase